MGSSVETLLEEPYRTLLCVNNNNDCSAAAAYILSLLRKEDQFGGKQNVMDFSKLYGASAKTLNKINNQKKRNPFAGGSNPFKRR